MTKSNLAIIEALQYYNNIIKNNPFFKECDKRN